jgi:replication fork clamp-binding protein CrfC
MHRRCIGGSHKLRRACMLPSPAGVLTKVDIMDRGTDCRDIVMGNTLRLKNGWVAVINRGQADIQNKVQPLQKRSSCGI